MKVNFQITIGIKVQMLQPNIEDNQWWANDKGEEHLDTPLDTNLCEDYYEDQEESWSDEEAEDYDESSALWRLVGSSSIAQCVAQHPFWDLSLKVLDC